jgi:inositol-phosphate phosphatase/L-galactose 1-phosphate phosphatase
MAQLQTYLEVAVGLATQAGQVIRKGFSEAKNVHYKGPTDLVTETDRQCEQLIRSGLLAAFPTHQFIGEEDTSDSGAKPVLTDAPTWMCDPLDGTCNYVHGFPSVCVSLGLAIKKDLVVGVVYNPILGELFTAVRGCGAFLNGQPIHASPQQELSKALVATEIGTTRDPETMAAIFDRVQKVGPPADQPAACTRLPRWPPPALILAARPTGCRLARPAAAAAPAPAPAPPAAAAPTLLPPPRRRRRRPRRR